MSDLQPDHTCLLEAVDDDVTADLLPAEGADSETTEKLWLDPSRFLSEPT